MINSKLFRWVIRVLDYIEKGTVLAGIALFVLINVVATFQVFVRFANLGISTTWTGEIARYLLVIMVFVGAPYAMRNNDNISIRPLFRLLPPLAQKVLITFSNIMVIAFSMLIIYSVSQVLDRTLGVTLTTVSWLTTGHAQVILGIMFVIVTLLSIENTILMWQSDGAPIKTEDAEPDVPENNLKMSATEGGD
jgi:TRAP-type C4-dicarboxylate transport system permease small subunit